MKSVNNVRPAICSTSQPLQTGFSLDSGGEELKTVGETGSDGGGIRICGSLFNGGRSKCGLSGDDKKVPLELKPRYPHLTYIARLKPRPFQNFYEPYALLFPFPAKYPVSAWPVYDFFTRATCSGVPCATMRPPSSPPSGPRSISQSALRITSRLCSMMMIQLPRSVNRWSTSSSFFTSSKCRPVVGSSKR